MNASATRAAGQPAASSRGGQAAGGFLSSRHGQEAQQARAQQDTRTSENQRSGSDHQKQAAGSIQTAEETQQAPEAKAGNHEGYIQQTPHPGVLPEAGQQARARARVVITKEAAECERQGTETGKAGNEDAGTRKRVGSLPVGECDGV